MSLYACHQHDTDPGLNPVVAAPAAQDILGLKRPSAVHTPRTDFVQPPPVGTVWTCGVRSVWALTEQMLRQCDRRGVFALKP